MQCLMPYAFISGANALIDILSFFRFLFSFQLISLPWIVLWATDIAQFAGLYFSWKIYELTQSASPSGYQSLGRAGDNSGDSGGLFSSISNAFSGGGGGGTGGGGAVNLPGRDRNPAGGSQAAGSGGFVPFGGQGNRLGQSAS